MSQITQVEFWKDVGFQDGAIEVPSASDTLSNPDAVFDEGIKTSTGDFFSSFIIPEVFSDYLSMSYIRATYTYNNSSDEMIIYGWIDDILLKSDTDGNPSVQVNWHIDHWRTYIANASFGYGLVRNRSRSADDPPQLCTYRYRRPHGFQSMEFEGVGKESYWIIATYTVENSDSKITAVRTMVVPVNRGDPTNSCYMRLNPTAPVYGCPSLYKFVNGKWTEAFGISPTSVSSVFISPVPPLAIHSGTGTADDPYVVLESSSATTEHYNERGGTYEPAHGNSITVKTGTTWSMTAEWTDSTTKKTASGSYGGIAIGNYIAVEFNKGFGKHIPSPTRTTINYDSNIDGDAYTYVVSLDTVIRNQIGDDAWNGLQNGDRFRFNGSVRYGTELEMSSTSTGSTVSEAVVNVIVGGYVSATEGVNREFVYNKDDDTFGDDVKVLIRTEKIGWSLFTKQSTDWFDYGMNEADGKCYIYTQNGHYFEYSQSLPDTFVWDDEEQTEVPIKTTDTVEWVFTDQTGVPLGTLPWGLDVRTYNIRNVISSTACYLEYRFDGIDSHMTGTSFIVALPTIDIVSNSWSEYVYSGQRDYDIEQRRIAAEQSMMTGAVSAITGGVDSAIMGALTNTTTNTTESRKYAYGKETASEEIIGNTTTTGIGGWKAGAIGIGTGLGGTLINYGLTVKYNGELQKADDILSAKQVDSVMMSGNGWDWMWNGREFGLSPLQGDGYSVKRFEDDIELNGISCSEPTFDCTELINMGGPLRITELIVTGNIPVQARAYIRGRFANGVRIKTINTVTPTEE